MGNETSKPKNECKYVATTVENFIIDRLEFMLKKEISINCLLRDFDEFDTSGCISDIDELDTSGFRKFLSEMLRSQIGEDEVTSYMYYEEGKIDY